MSFKLPSTPLTPPSATISSSFIFLPASQHSKYTFPISAFLEKDYNPTSFVTKYRPQVDSLQTLQQECVELYAFLHEQTISLIHNDYSAFIEFSAHLAQLKDQVDQVSQPLPSLTQPLASFHSALEKLIYQCNNEISVLDMAQRKQRVTKELLSIHSQLKLLSEKQIISDKADLHVNKHEILAYAHQVQHLKIQLDHIHSTDLKSIPNNESHKKHFEAIQSFYYKCDASWRQIDASYFTKLRDIFNLITSSPETSNKDDLKACIEAFKILGRNEWFYSYISQFWLEPLCESIFNKNRQLSRVNVYRSLEQLLTDKKGKWFLLISQAQEWKVLCRLVLPAIVRELSDQKMRHLYEYRDRVKFHENYIDQQQFFVDLKQLLFSTELNMDDLRAGELEFESAIESLKSKWQLRVYFTLVRQHIATQIDHILSNYQKALEIVKDDEGFEYAVTKTLYHTLMKECFHSSVFVEALSSDFCQLLITLLSRFEKLACDLTIDTSREAMVYVHLLFDIQILQSKLQSDLIERMKNLVSIEYIETLEMMTKLVQDSIKSRLASTSNQLSKLIVGHLAPQCSEGFSSQKMVQSSNYVSQVLKPLSMFLKRVHTYREKKKQRLIEIGGFDSEIDIDQSFIDQWTADVVFQICKDFLANALETKKTQLAILRVRNRSKKGNETSDQIEKMIEKLRSDASEFEKLVKQMVPHVDLTQSESFQELCNLTSNE